jgi:D-proline reductase (dithiol) PrdB
MSDKAFRLTRAAIATEGGLELTTTPWTSPVQLSRARVAIVTTAGLRGDGQDRWNPGDLTFTVLPGRSRRVAMVHASTNFDRAGFNADINVVYPIDRLRELAEQGVIASVAPRNISFMGATGGQTMTTLLIDTGPAAARLLRDDGVDLAILTPV